MRAGVAARFAAARIVSRVLRRGAFSNIVARTETRGLETQDARFARRLAYETLRQLLRIDRAIAALSERPISQIDARVLDALRVGAGEILFVGAAVHAAVDGTVEVARLGKRAAAGFANAVLRRLVVEGEPPLPDGEAGDALRVGQPLWLYRHTVHSWGKDEATAFFLSSQQPAPRTARRRWGSSTGRPYAGLPEAVLVEEGDLGEGLVVQDPASIAVGKAMAPKHGDRVLDMAAAPGGKTLHLADQLAGTGLLVANDRHPGRLQRAGRRLRGYGVNVLWCVADGSRVPFADATFDRVLVDAPCTGLGTLRRRPEVRYRLGPDDAALLAVTQRGMVEEALRVVKRGGAVVYSVCTVTPEETIGVIAGLPAFPPSRLPGRRWGDGWLMAPHLTETDGMFITILQR